LPIGFFKSMKLSLAGNDTLLELKVVHHFTGHTTVRLKEQVDPLFRYINVKWNIGEDNAHSQNFEVDEFLKVVDGIVADLQQIATEVKQASLAP
jgi:hypothetical protein